jgi:hypothetical protein
MSQATLVFALSTAVALIGLAIVFMQLRRLRREHFGLKTAYSSLQKRFSGVLDAEAERQRILSATESDRQRIVSEAEAERSRIASELERTRVMHEESVANLQQLREVGMAELRELQANIARLHEEFRALDEEANLQSFGFYKPRYDFSSSQRYEVRLEEIRTQQKRMVSGKTAAVCSIEWTVNGSRSEGRKQISHTLRLILRAFNGECDAAIAKVKYNNIGVMQTRIRKAWEAINGLVSTQSCEITRGYFELKLDELALVHEYQEKVQEEKEEQRQIREQMREEEIALREMEKARQEAEREEKRYSEALRKAQDEAERTVGAKHDALMIQIQELQQRLAEAQANRQRAIARAQMTRSGHVYIISNVGSFGENVYKIGMTRRLDPMERVRELGDASVPFQFDVHAVIYSDDAPGLENLLHRRFRQRRVNLVNERKEFFEVDISEIADVVRTHDAEIELTLIAEAREYRSTLALRAERNRLAEERPVAIPFSPDQLPAPDRVGVPSTN